MQITQNEPTAAERRIPFLAVRASANSLQLVDLGDIATGDTFTLTVTTTTGAITYAADMSSAIVTALEGLAEVGAGDVQAFKLSAGQVYAVGFAGSLTGTSIPLMVIGSPTTFTPGNVTGGVSDSAVTGLGGDWPAADIEISKAGGAFAEGTGTVTEGDHGVYLYEAASAEVDTLGALVGVVLTFGVSVYPLSAQIIDASSAGETVLRTGTAQAGTSSSITLDSGASGESNAYVPCLVYFESGTGSGRQGAVYGYAYNGATKELSFEPNVNVPASSDTVFKLVLTAPIAWDFSRANHAAANTFGDVSEPADVASEVLVTLTTDSMPFAGANIDAAISTRATPAQVATELATYDGPTKAEMDARTLPSADYATASALATVDTEVGVIDGIVDDILLDTAEIGAAGAGLTAVASAANLATVAGYIDTEVAAIKAKTDNLPASPAATGDIPTAAANAAALLDLTDGVETDVTVRQALRLFAAALGGKLTGGGTTTITIRDVGDTKNRIVATVDSNGNRSVVTLDLD